jgi:PAS domain-containing protein
MILRYARNAFIALGIVLLAGFLLVKTQAIDHDAHDQFNSDLRRLKELDATINQDVLKSRQDLLANYDPFVSKLNEVKGLRNNLKKLAASAHLGQNEITQSLDAYGDVLAQKESLIERFKSDNAVLKNSLRYLPVLTTELAGKGDSELGVRASVAQLNVLLQDVLIYSLHAEEELAPKIRGELDLLVVARASQSDSWKQDLSIVVSHTRAILKYRSGLNQLITELIQLPTSERAEALLNTFNEYHNQSLRTADTYRLFLYLLSVTLACCIGYAVLQLKNSTRSLNEANKGLRQREAENRALLNAIPDSMLRINKAGLILDFRSAKDDTASIPERCISKSVDEVFPCEIASRAMHAIQEALASGTVQSMEYSLSIANDLRQFEARIAVSGNDETLVLLRDITERWRAVDELSRAKEAAAANIAKT